MPVELRPGTWHHTRGSWVAAGCGGPTEVDEMPWLVVSSALVIVALLVVLLRVRGELVWTERRAAELANRLEVLGDDLLRLDAEKSLLRGFLGVLPALAQELRHAATERQIASTLIDTLVSTIEPRQAVILIRRRGPSQSGDGLRLAVAAATPPGSPVALGFEIVVRGPARSPDAFDTEVLRRAGLPLASGACTAPLILETELVGLISVTPSVPGPDVPRIVQAIADVGSLALHEAAARQRVRRVANVDELTQLFNRRYIGLALAEELGKAQQGSLPLSVFLFDIDHFKRYNDLNGHLAGDILLRLLAQLVQGSVRATDVVGRFGGEEFLVILPRTALVEAYLVADKLRDMIARHDFPLRGRQPLGLVSVSGGVAEFPTHGSSASALLRVADQALYAAKREGRNRVVLASAGTSFVGPEGPHLEEEWGEDL